jgi:IS5 family transposase
MDRRIWSIIGKAVAGVNRSVPRQGRRPGYRDSLIVRMYLWSVWHDRPLCWACDRHHYGALFRPRVLPSVSQFCRRMKSPRVGQLLERLNGRLTQGRQRCRVTFLDGKPLPVSRNSRDKQARKGYADGVFRRGYKLHAWAGENGRILRHCVRSMNEGEPNTARQLIDGCLKETFVLADANYDSAKLYRTVAEHGGQLLTPLKGRASDPVRLRYMPPARRQMMKLWQENPAFCRRRLEARAQIERIFSALTCFGGGLSPLPAWVRTLPRVQRWVAGKLAIYHARLLAKEAA